MICKGLQRENCLEPNCKYINGEKRKYCRTSKNNRNIVRTFSRCRGIERTNCLPPDCKYANGVKRQYCRISKNTKRRVSLNISKKNKAASVIQRFMKKTRKHNTQKKSENKASSNNQENRAAEIIQKFMKKTTDKIKKKKEKENKIKVIGEFIAKSKSKYLTRVCSDSGVCIAFGKETNKIKSFFNNFDDFKYKNKVKRLSEGVNGIVYDVEYERLKYKAYTIMKMSKNKDSDNLIYEYLVGIFFINTVYKKFPCFLETYNFCLTPNDLNNQKKFLNIINKEEIKDIISLSCVDPTNIGIQIEYLKNPIELNDALGITYFWRTEIMQVLFQIYCPLFALREVFTHYDLHASNVLLYEPVKNHYIHYHYHLEKGEMVSFKSRYIVKIIDYGRCYFNNKSKNISSPDIREIVCDEAECNKGFNVCGDRVGYGWLEEENNENKKNQYVNSSILNRSHDLQIINDVSERYKKTFEQMVYYDYDTNNDIDKLFKKTKYGNKQGTKEIVKSGLPRSVNNVPDAFKLLKKICLNSGFIDENNDKYNVPEKKLGDLHIYGDGSDRDMVFTSSKI